MYVCAFALTFSIGMPDSHFLAGVGAGVLTSLSLHPLDLVKVKFQVQDGLLRANRYTSILGAVRTIAAEEGLRGFYRGVVPGAWGSGASWGFYFFFYEACKRRIGPGVDDRGVPLPLSPVQHMYAAVEGGSLTCLMTNPLWLVKTRMQTLQAGSSGSALGMWGHLLAIARAEGLPGLYRGLVPALLLTSHGAIQFSVYEWCKVSRVGAGLLTSIGVQGVESRDGKGTASTSALFLYGAVSKAVAVTATYPYQVIKSRIQQALPTTTAAPATPGAPGADSAAASSRPYRGVLDAARRMVAHEGVRSFYKGFGTNLLRVAPQSAITLSSYEWIRAALDRA